MTLLIFLSVGSNSYALDSVVLQKNDPAPFNGLLFSNGDANIIRVQLLERDTYFMLNGSYEKSLNLMDENSTLKDEQIKLLMDNNILLVKRLRDEKDVGTWERLAWFGLGVIATGAAVYGIKKITY